MNRYGTIDTRNKAQDTSYPHYVVILDTLYSVLQERLNAGYKEGYELRSFHHLLPSEGEGYMAILEHKFWPESANPASCRAFAERQSA